MPTPPHAQDQLWSDRYLDQLRLRGDPLADAVVQEIYAGGHGCVGQINRLMRQVQREEDPLPAGLPASLRRLLEADQRVGRASAGWDEEQLAQGAHFFRRYSLGILIMLQLGTMPQAYTSDSAAHVLTFTARLERYAVQRSLETGQMLYDVMAPGGLREGGLGRRSIQKVRLMHAAVRHLVSSSGRWDQDRFGAPINQEEMLGTLGCFCVVVLEGLRKMGAQFPEHEGEAFYARWRAVSVLLGIPEESLPTDLEGARRQFQRIKARCERPSPEGQRLMSQWQEALRAMFPLPGLHPYLPAAIEYLLDEGVMQVLAVPVKERHRRAARRVLPRLLWADRWMPHDHLGRHALDDVFWWCFQYFYKKELKNRPSFPMPAPSEHWRAGPR